MLLLVLTILLSIICVLPSEQYSFLLICILVDIAAFFVIISIFYYFLSRPIYYHFPWPMIQHKNIRMCNNTGWHYNIGVNFVIKVGGGAHGKSRARSYNGGLRTEGGPPAGSKGRALVRGQSPPWSWKHFCFSEVQIRRKFAQFCYHINCSDMRFKRISLCFYPRHQTLPTVQLCPLLNQFLYTPQC